MSEIKQIKRAVRIFWAWQDEREEQWLRHLAKQGWHLQHVNFLVYTFTPGEPRDMVYKLDYQQLKKGDRSEYAGIFKAAGWELVCDFANWHYFRIPAQVGYDFDIFSDSESRAAKYRRLLGVLVIFLPIMLVNLRNLLMQAPERMTGLYASIRVIYIILLALFSYAIVRILIRINRLRKTKSGAKS